MPDLNFLCIIWNLFLKGKKYASGVYLGVIFLSCAFYFFLGQIIADDTRYSGIPEYKRLSEFVFASSWLQIIYYVPTIILLIQKQKLKEP